MLEKSDEHQRSAEPLYIFFARFVRPFSFTSASTRDAIYYGTVDGYAQEVCKTCTLLLAHLILWFELFFVKLAS